MSATCSMSTPAALRLLAPRARADADLELTRAWAQADRVVDALQAKVAPAQQVRVALGALLADPAVKAAIGQGRWDYFHAKYLGVSAGLREDGLEQEVA